MIARKEPFPASVVYGRGRLGSALTAALHAAGAPVELRPGRDARPSGAPLLLLAVPDDAIEATAGRIAAALPEAHGVAGALHFSGIRGAEALAALAARGVPVGTCHPLQSFPEGAGPESFTGVLFAVTGDPAARAVARALAETLGGRALEIEEGKKPLWHLAASLAANGAVGLLGAALEALGGAGLDEEEARAALQPLVTTAVSAAFARGPSEALTGPVARGDAGTLARHRAALASWDAGRLALFEALVREQERLVERRGKRRSAV